MDSRNKYGTFTGAIEVIAHFSASRKDWEEICEEGDFEGQVVQIESMPKAFTVATVHKYSEGNFVESANIWHGLDFQFKCKNGRKWREAEASDAIWQKMAVLAKKHMPTVVYFPTFLFDFPKEIYLTRPDRNPVNHFFVQVLRDVLSYRGEGEDIQKHILDKILKSDEDNFWTWDVWSAFFFGGASDRNAQARAQERKDQAQHVLNCAAETITDVVCHKWDMIFGNGASQGMEFSLQLDAKKREVKSQNQQENTDEREVFVRIAIKQGTSTFSVRERSLGFRWFLSFLLFTQFRIHREGRRPILFLLDEPASNLHARAQMKLLETFPIIAEYPHRMIYSTHSHYMIDSKWLEQAFIVRDANESDPDGQDMVMAGRARKTPVNIQAVPYREFVRLAEQNDSLLGYFQPISDVLEIQPSKFDVNVGGLIVEGRSDFYLIKLAELVTGINLPPIFPAMGASTMEKLVALHIGWGLPVRIMFDSDGEGESAERKLKEVFLLADSNIAQIGMWVNGARKIEDIISAADKKHLVRDVKPEKSKKFLWRRAQELVAGSEAKGGEFSEETKEKMVDLLNGIISFVGKSSDGSK